MVSTSIRPLSRYGRVSSGASKLRTWMLGIGTSRVAVVLHPAPGTLPAGHPLAIIRIDHLTSGFAVQVSAAAMQISGPTADGMRDSRLSPRTSARTHAGQR